MAKEQLEELRPYTFHGLELKQNGDSYVGECPFCGREGKFAVKVGSGLWRCVVCDKGGNHVSFIRELWSVCDEATTPDMYEELLESRKLLDKEVLIQWEVVKSPFCLEWLIPGYNADGKLVSLYKYTKIEGHPALLPTPVLGQQMFGVGLYDKAKPIAFITEGPWDGMALWEALRSAKVDKEGQFLVSHNYGETILAESNVIAVPGANNFNPSWAKLFADKTVYIMFDNDYPKINKVTNKPLDPVGMNGMKRVAGILTGSENPPAEVLFLNWGEKGYTEAFPDGTDVRDLLTKIDIL